MSSPLTRQRSGFGLDLLLREVIRSNEVLWGLPQCPRCFYVTCIWNVWHQRWPPLQRCDALGWLKASLHWPPAPGAFAWLPVTFAPRVIQWSLCLAAWRKFSLVAVRLKPCLSCVYPVFIWRMSSEYSVWGGIVSWLLWSVLNVTVVFLSCFSCGMSRFFYTHICEERCLNG